MPQILSVACNNYKVFVYERYASIQWCHVISESRVKHLSFKYWKLLKFNWHQCRLFLETQNVWPLEAQKISSQNIWKSEGKKRGKLLRQRGLFRNFQKNRSSIVLNYSLLSHVAPRLFIFKVNGCFWKWIHLNTKDANPLSWNTWVLVV